MSRYLVKITKLSLIIISPLLLLSCSKYSTGFVAKAWHGTNSFFNGYYNANEIYKEATKRIDEMYKYPDETFFQVVYFGTEDEVKGFETDFDRIIEKNDIVIFKHPNGGWVDNCRLLTGKSWLYKKNFTLAMENFDEVLDKFPESKLIPEVYLWKAIAHYQAGDHELAVEVMEKHIYPFDTLKFRKRAAVDRALFETQLAIDNEAYESAIVSLESCIENIPDRQNKSEAYFLLGQLYAETDQFPKALETYSLVEKYSQDYDLTFSSKMKVARLYVDYQEGQDDDYSVNKYLTKMLNDDKNYEYRDRIYYEFGMLELKRDSLYNAIDNFRLSLEANMGNQRTQAMANFKIGIIFFEDLMQYDSAQVYLDAAAASIAEDEPEYFQITTLAKTLREYVTYKNTIAYQDSMLYLATLPKEEVDKIVAKVVAEEERKRLEELRKEQERLRAEQAAMNEGMGQMGNNTFLQNFGDMTNQRQMGASSWYFDNPSAVTGGIQQFQQKWGQRQNEDNWRRRSKSMGFAGGPGEAEEGEGSAGKDGQAATAEVDSALLKEFGDNYQYYKDIPRDEKMVQAANEKIEEALYKLAQLYEIRLEEPDSAIKTYEILLDRYDESEYALSARYALYQLYLAQENPIYNVHRNYIVNEHPKTVYAYLILGKDPRELRQSEDDFSYAYTGLFSAYRDRQYETAIGFSDFLLAQFSGNPQIDMAELHYIRGMSFGYLGYQDSLLEILSFVVNSYPNSDVTPIARQTLNYLRNGTQQTPERLRPEDNSAAKPKEGEGLKNPNHPRYQGFADKPKPTDKIFVLLYVDQNNISKNDATIRVSNFNTANYKDANLKTFTFLYQGTHLLPYVSHFTTVEDAAAYVNKFLASPESKELLLGEGDKIFYISHSNFKVAYGRKRMEDYIVYYENILTGK